MTNTPSHNEKKSYKAEKVVYGLDIAKGAAIGGTLGFGVGWIGDFMHNDVFPAAAELDSKVGKIMTDVGGQAGKTTIGIDKKVGDFWGKLVGRSEKDKEAWRKEHGIKNPKYLEQVDGQPRSDEVSPLQSSHYTSSWTALGLLAGASYGALKGLGNYIKGKRDRDIARETAALRKVNEQNTSLLQKYLQRNNLEDEVSP
ncbi:MAG: hypothetical protein Q7R56_00220 [Nanoarchaeota archaeon]|nr:hypothetical protein [Nanoarchaeota archaeon]